MASGVNSLTPTYNTIGRFADTPSLRRQQVETQIEVQPREFEEKLNKALINSLRINQIIFTGLGRQVDWKYIDLSVDKGVGSEPLKATYEAIVGQGGINKRYQLTADYDFGENLIKYEITEVLFPKGHNIKGA